MSLNLLRARRWRTSLTATLLLPLLVACTSISVDPDYERGRRLPGPDESVIGLAGSYSFSDDEFGEREWLDVRLEAGTHIEDEHELGAWLLTRYSNRTRDEEARYEGWGGLHYRYHWYPGERTSVFVGPTAGLALFDDGQASDRSFGFGAQVGARHWVSTNAALSLTPTFFWVDNDSEDGGSAREVVIYWGVSFKL